MEGQQTKVIKSFVWDQQKFQSTFKPKEFVQAKPVEVESRENEEHYFHQVKRFKAGGHEPPVPFGVV